MNIRRKIKYWWRRFEPYIVIGETISILTFSPIIFYPYNNLNSSLASLSALVAFGISRVIDRYTSYRAVEEINKKFIERGIDSSSFLLKEFNPLFSGIYKDGKSFLKKSLRAIPLEFIAGLTSYLYPSVGYGISLVGLLAGGNNIYQTELKKYIGKKYLDLKEMNSDESLKPKIVEKIEKSKVLNPKDKEIIKEIISYELKTPLQKNSGKLMKKMLYYA
jgi:hypothetical protein